MMPAASLAAAALLAGSPVPAPADVGVAEWQAEVEAFLGREIKGHCDQVDRLEPPPERVHGELTGGECTWGTFVPALAAHAEAAGANTLDERDLASFVGRLGLLESRAGAKAFSKMYAAFALRHFGANLERN